MSHRTTGLQLLRCLHGVRGSFEVNFAWFKHGSRKERGEFSFTLFHVLENKIICSSDCKLVVSDGSREGGISPGWPFCTPDHICDQSIHQAWPNPTGVCWCASMQTMNQFDHFNTKSATTGVICQFRRFLKKYSNHKFHNWALSLPTPTRKVTTGLVSSADSCERDFQGPSIRNASSYKKGILMKVVPKAVSFRASWMHINGMLP